MKRFNFKIYLIFVSLSMILWVACKRGKDKDSQTTSDIEISGDTVTVASNSPVLSKLKLFTVTSESYNSLCTTTGTVKPLSGHLAEVSAPFDGRIVKSCVRLGERVSKGSPLFQFSSVDYLNAVKDLISAKQAKLLSEKNYERKKDLVDHGIASKKDFEEAQADYAVAQKEYEKAVATLKIYNTRTANLDIAAPLIVRSPIGGEVVKDNIIVGQYQKVDADPVVTVADLDKVWVVAQVKEKNIGQVSRQDKVKVLTESFPDSPLYGFVDYVGNMMDEQTRSVEVYIVCENHNKILKPGMFVTVDFIHHHSSALIVPASSVLQQGDKSFVYIRIAANRFVKKQVAVSTTDNSNLVVHSGLQSGSVIVADGGIYLQ